MAAAYFVKRVVSAAPPGEDDVKLRKDECVEEGGLKEAIFEMGMGI